MAQQFLDIWLATGTNLLYTQALLILQDFEEKPDYYKEVLESMTADVMQRMMDLQAKWQAAEALTFSNGGQAS